MIPRIVYGGVFCALLPAALWAWCAAIGSRVSIPGVHDVAAGAAVACVGMGLMCWACVGLWRETRGLPMNAFPARRRAVGGAFAWLEHPIYIGAVLAWAGVALAVGAAAALWIGTPVLALGCAALVWGYERDATNARLGPRTAPTRIRWCGAGASRPDGWDIVSTYVLVFLPWLVLYETTGHAPTPDAVSAYLMFERGWPVFEQAEMVYVMAYPLALAAPLLATTREGLARFQRSAAAAMALAFWCYLVIPLIAPPKPFEPRTWLGDLLMMERSAGYDGRAAFPSFHVYWSLASAAVIGRRGGWWRVGAWAIAAAVTVSCLLVGMHAVVDVLAGAALFAIVWRHERVWSVMVRGAETVANGWREWRLGPVRVLMHAAYASAAAFAGVLTAVALAGPGSERALGLIAVCGLIGAGVWGQIVTGGGGLARPYGYYGHVLGVVAAVGVLFATSERGWAIAAACATAAPVAQAIGRLRCLVQGCCHGRALGAGVGVRYMDARSRAMRYAGLGGVAVHATPVYSMIGNVLIIGLLLRLWSVGAEASMIAGAYFVLAGLARFVEEHYRGEPRTPIIGGLRLYQWFACGSVVVGFAIAVIRSPAVELRPGLEPASFVAAAVIAALYGVAMGVDLPDSARRFARLG